MYKIRLMPSPEVLSVSPKNLWVMIALLVLTACRLSEGTNETLLDRSFLTGEPCAAPCWYGLELDQSSNSDVLATLRTLPFVAKDSMREYVASWLGEESATEITFNCSEPKGEPCGSFIIAEGKLKQIVLFIHYKLSIETTVNQIGPPAYLRYVPYDIGGGNCRVIFSWPDRNIIAMSDDTRDDPHCEALGSGQVKIRPEMQIMQLTYVVSKVFNLERGGTPMPWPGLVEP